MLFTRIVSGLGVVLLASLTMAGAAQKPDANARVQRPKGDVRKPELGSILLSPQAQEKLNLSAEQKKKVEEITKDFQAKQKDFQEKLENAKKDRDRFKYREAIEGAEKLKGEQLARLKDLLTDAQKKMLEDLVGQKPAGRPGLGLVRGAGIPGQLLPPVLQERLNLTEDQKKKLADLQKDAETKLRDLLTEDQRKLLERGNQRPAKP